MIYMLTYDLNRSGQNYQLLYNQIKALGETIHPLQNLWIISTMLSASEIVDNFVGTSIDENDRMFVSKINRNEWGGFLNPSDIQWIQERL